MPTRGTGPARRMASTKPATSGNVEILVTAIRPAHAPRPAASRYQREPAPRSRRRRPARLRPMPARWRDCRCSAPPRGRGIGAGTRPPTRRRRVSTGRCSIASRSARYRDRNEPEQDARQTEQHVEALALLSSRYVVAEEPRRRTREGRQLEPRRNTEHLLPRGEHAVVEGWLVRLQSGAVLIRYQRPSTRVSTFSTWSGSSFASPHGVATATTRLPTTNVAAMSPKGDAAG